MASVTSIVILFPSAYEKDKEKIDSVFTQFKIENPAGRNYPFEWVDVTLSGGIKPFESEMMIAGINYLDKKKFAKYLLDSKEEIGGSIFEDIQILIKEDNDRTFKLYRVFDYVSINLNEKQDNDEN